MTSTPDGHSARGSNGALEVVSQVLDVLPDQRFQLAESLCNGNAERLSRVLHLLGLEQAAKSFLERPLLDLADGGEAAPGRRIGDYTLVKLIGAGGSALVYEAIEDGSTDRFALKTLQPHAASRTALRRLEREAECLGKLDHPGIARVYRYETATPEDETSWPYLVLELVEGKDILAHCLFANLGLADKLRLVRRVCDSVEHAHQRGIIHRDLKPANILINASGQPKVLDFGIACSVENDDFRSTFTRSGDVLGTIQYMSPEQMLGEQDAISTRSDVYSLGVLIYRLMTGQFPYVMKGTVAAAAETLRTIEPIPPRKQNPRINSDLEAIVLKAIEKKPERRHASAGELAREIDVLLANHPPVLEQSGAERGWHVAIQACRKLLGFGARPGSFRK